MASASRRRRGRPTKISDALVQRICDAVEKGVPFKYACEHNGVDAATAYRWLCRGEAAEPGDEAFSRFLQALRRARARAVVALVKELVADGAAGARWLLERCYPREFGAKQRVEHSGPDGAPIAFKTPLREMSDDELVAIASAAGDAGGNA